MNEDLLQLAGKEILRIDIQGGALHISTTSGVFLVRAATDDPDVIARLTLVKMLETH